MTGTTRTLSYNYDTNGNVTDVIHPDNNWFGTFYDGLNRPYFMWANGTYNLAYASYGSNGTLTGTSQLDAYQGHGYDAVQRPTSLTHIEDGSSVEWTYSLNPAGQIAQVSRDNNSYAWGGHYAVNRSYTANGLNQYSAVGGTGFDYDDNGNLISDGSHSYGYDIENRLISAPNDVELSYDPLGRLFQISVDEAVTTTFLYDSDALVAEYNGSGTMTRRYAHWPSVDTPMFSYEGTGVSAPTSQLMADHQGSIVGLADSSGALTHVNSYDEQGIPGSGNTGRFQYTGQAWLDEIGMYYYKARIYSPTLGRFLQTDPIGYEGGMNLYAYVLNDPVNLADPSGLDQVCYYERVAGRVDSNGINGGNVGITANGMRQVCIDVLAGDAGLGPSFFDRGPGTGGGGNPPRPQPPQPPDPFPACQAAARAAIAYFITMYSAAEGMEAAEALSAMRGARAGGFLGSRAGWIGAGIGAITGIGLFIALRDYREYVVMALCDPAL